MTKIPWPERYPLCLRSIEPIVRESVRLNWLLKVEEYQSPRIDLIREN